MASPMNPSPGSSTGEITTVAKMENAQIPFDRAVVHVPQPNASASTSITDVSMPLPYGSSSALPEKDRKGLLTRIRSSPPRSSLDRFDNELVRRRSSRLQANIPQHALSFGAYQPYQISSSNLRNIFPTGKISAGHSERTHLDDRLLNAVVRVTACICQPNYELPWQMKEESISTSTAFVISDRRLITVAHGILFHTVVRVKKRSSDELFVAKVLCVAEECDLALLTVEDEAFWDDDIPALEFGSLPALQDDITTVGYPISGENICLTSGVTSRIEMQGGFLIIQIDAAINLGNSGGPAFYADGKVAGVAFQKSENADNQGFLIATDVVNHFLTDYERNNAYTGSCTCGFLSQPLPAADIRRYLKMSKGDTGVLVVKVPKSSPAFGIVKENDVVLCIDGNDISNTGSIPHSSGERLYFQFLIADKFRGDPLELTLLRDGERLEVTYKLGCSNLGKLIPEYADEKKPEYYIIAGLVFTTITEPYLSNGYGPSGLNRPPQITELVRNGMDEEEVDQYVLLSKVLNHEINVDYSLIFDERLYAINGTKVLNLQHLKDIINESTDDFLRFDLGLEIIVLDRKKALEANQYILEVHDIPSLSRIHPREE